MTQLVNVSSRSMSFATLDLHCIMTQVINVIWFVRVCGGGGGRFLATIRNKLVHERGFDQIPDRPRFIAAFEKVPPTPHPPTLD